MSNSVLSQVDDVQLGASLREAPDLQLNTLKSAIRRLDLSNFRNYRSLRLELDVTPVVLTGSNGAGKTNLMEALSFLAPGRGLRHVPLEILHLLAMKMLRIAGRWRCDMTQ